jgi:dynein heavy chain
MEGPMSGVNPDNTDQEVGNFRRNLYKLEKGFGDVPAAKKIASKVKAKVEEFQKNMPLVQTLFNPGLRDRHWEKISEIVGFNLKPDDDMCLSKLIDMNLENHIPKFENISEAASKEFSLEKALEKMKSEWEPMEFTTIPYRETGTHILSAIDDIQLLLDDHIVKTQTMRGSPFIKPFEAEIK